MEPIYKRVLLKISGEALAGSDHFGISEEMTRKVAKEVKQIHELGVEIAIVVGGGNFWRVPPSCRAGTWIPAYRGTMRRAGRAAAKGGRRGCAHGS